MLRSANSFNGTGPPLGNKTVKETRKMRNRWLRATIAATVLFVVVVLIVIGCSMKHRAPANANTSAGKNTQQTTVRKERNLRRRVNAHRSAEPCAPSVATREHGNSGISDSARLSPQDSDAPTLQSHSTAPSVIRILIAVETEKQPDPAFRLFQPPAQAGRRPPNSGWQHFRPQAGE